MAKTSIVSVAEAWHCPLPCGTQLHCPKTVKNTLVSYIAVLSGMFLTVNMSICINFGYYLLLLPLAHEAHKLPLKLVSNKNESCFKLETFAKNHRAVLRNN